MGLVWLMILKLDCVVVSQKPMGKVKGLELAGFFILISYVSSFYINQVKIS